MLSRRFSLRHACLFAAVLTLVILAGCKKKDAAVEAIEAVPVRIHTVTLEDIQTTLEYVGNISARNEAQVFPKVPGKIIEKVKEEGARVAKGDTIALIDRDEIGLKFEQAPVESPLSGVVGRVYVDIGTNVSVQTPIALVVDMDTVTIDLDIPEKYLPRIQVGNDAQLKVDAYPEKEFHGVVTKVSPVLDLGSRSAPVEISVENAAHELQSGMFARVSLVLEERKGVAVILKEAIVGKGESQLVYVVEGDKAVRRKISTGIQQGPYIEASAGLVEGEKVVVMGQQRLKEGSQVIAEEEQ